MNTFHLNTWTEWFIHNIQQAPFQILHMRELAETTVAAADTTAVKVTGGRDQAPLPFRVDPADDADLLYATLIIFGLEIAEKIGGSSPSELRNTMWRGSNEPQGLPSCTPGEAFTMSGNIVRWLTTCAPLIAQDPTLNDTPDDLVRVIRRMSARYPRTHRFKAYRTRPCPICNEHTIEAIFDEDSLTGARCDNCETTWTHSNDRKP